jgi:hypothetical protein
MTFNAEPSMRRQEGMFYITNESKFGTNEISNQGHHPNILDIRIVLCGQSTTCLLSISLKIHTTILTMSNCLLFASTLMLSSFKNW